MFPPLIHLKMGAKPNAGCTDLVPAETEPRPFTPGMRAGLELFPVGGSIVKFPLLPLGSGSTVTVGVAVAGVDSSLDGVATLVLIGEADRLKLVVPAGDGEREVDNDDGSSEIGRLESDGLGAASVGAGVRAPLFSPGEESASS